MRSEKSVSRKLGNNFESRCYCGSHLFNVAPVTCSVISGGLWPELWLKTLKNTVFLAKILRKNRSAISIAIFAASGCSPQLRVFTLVALRVFTQMFLRSGGGRLTAPGTGFPCFLPYPCPGSGSYSLAWNQPRIRQISRPSICIESGSYPRPGSHRLPSRCPRPGGDF